MSYQDPIYSQNGTGEINETVGVVNTSSDICVFNMPFFTMSGASKVACDTQVCSISGISYDNTLTAATECFTTAEMSGACFNSVNWSTKIYQDNTLVYNNIFYTSANPSDAPVEADFSGSVVTAFDTLGYTYSFSGTEYTIEQDGFVELRLDLETELSYIPDCRVTGNTTGDTSCSCPSGTTVSPAVDACQSFAYTAATTGATVSAVAGDTCTCYDRRGVAFIANADTYDWPLQFSGTSGVVGAYSGTNFMIDANGSHLDYAAGGPGTTYYDKPEIENSLWGNGGISSGRMNNIGIQSSPSTTNQWLGFAFCIDIETAGTYYLGMGADDQFRTSIDGEQIFEQILPQGGIKPPYTSYSMYINHFYVFEINLTSGQHIFEMEYRDTGGLANMAMELYSGTSIEALSAMTTESQLSAVTIFTTGDQIGQNFEIGDSVGFGCPDGYVYDACYTGSTRCVEITNNEINCIYTGDCTGGTTEVICDLDFSGLTLNDSNVYCITGQTNIDVDFTFTANTSSLSGNTQFRFDVYKYSNTLGQFLQPALYSSSGYSWSSFSATSAFTASIPVDNLNIDGDYLIKGYYLFDACTEFAGLLGDQISTGTNITGDEYGIYKPDRDFYFVGFTCAEKPVLDFSTGDTAAIGSLIVASFILDGTETEFSLPPTFGDYIIALNGSTLGPTLDYNIVFNSGDEENGIVAAALRLSGATVSGDVLTFAYTSSSSSNSLKHDGLEITSPIVSGVTDAQGSETVYYNTTEGKYEFYTTLPILQNDVVVTLNGVTLANNIDYYRSISNDKRIIFEGTILVGDVINVYYNSDIGPQGNVSSTFVNIGWTIDTPPQTTNGLFTVEIATDEGFTNIVNSGTTGYVVGQVGYRMNLDLIGEVGDTLYYRVKNEKSYIDLCGNALNSENYSDIIDITIQTNAINSY